MLFSKKKIRFSPKNSLFSRLMVINLILFESLLPLYLNKKTLTISWKNFQEEYREFSPMLMATIDFNELDI